jgi:hypothetical protein
MNGVGDDDARVVVEAARLGGLRQLDDGSGLLDLVLRSGLRVPLKSGEHAAGFRVAQPGEDHFQEAWLGDRIHRTDDAEVVGACGERQQHPGGDERHATRAAAGLTQVFRTAHRPVR